MKKRQTYLGFTLVELMITLAIVSILAAVAYPSYMNTVRRSNRAEAKTELMDIAQRLQRCYTAYGRFDDPGNLNRCTVYEQMTSIAPNYITTRGRGFYRITITHPGLPATSYTLTATANLAPQTLDVNGCNVLTLTSTGIQGPVPAAPLPPCW
ncbi:MAG: type IV pilin protein [Pseudomonadota bacterium]